MFTRPTGLPVLLLLACSLAGAIAAADVINVAVASNFAAPARALAERFENESQHSVRVSTGSTGKLYAQIMAGAPFHVFLAADEERPERMLSEGGASAVLVYAIGRPVLVSADPALVGRECITAFLGDQSATLAIANPATAPYGRAATEWLHTVKASPRILKGDNVAQAMLFVMSQNARFGVVAESQLLAPEAATRVWPGCIAPLPDDSFAPVRQAAALVDDSKAGREFFAFLERPDTRALVASFGYAMPGVE